MTAATANAVPAASRAPRRATFRVVAVSAVLAAVSLFWTAAENHYGQCVAAQAASQPAAPASAGGCNHFLFF